MRETRIARLARPFLLLMACWLASAPQPSLADEDSRFARITLSGQVVDEAGKPVVGAVVLYRDYREWRSRTGLDGEFSVSIRDDLLSQRHHSFRMLATTDDGRLGVFNSGLLKRLDPVRIVVKPGRTIRVRVVDAEDNPVDEASVTAMSDEMGVFEGKTGPDGCLSFPIPVDSTKNNVAALKSKVGLAFVTTQPNFRVTAPIRPLPDSLTMKLDGAAPPLRVKAVDGQGEPIPELPLTVLLGRVAGVDVWNGLERISKVQTGRDGVAVFDWLPRDIGETVTVFPSSYEYYPKDSYRRLSTSIETDQIIVHVRSSHLTGRIRTTDGQPVAGAGVQASGFGRVGNVASAMPATDYADSEGRYSMATVSDLAYVVTAKMGDLIGFGEAATITRPGERTEAGDIILRPGTWLHGTVTTGKTAIPAPDQYIGVWGDRGSIPDAVLRADTKPDQRMRINFSNSTDKAGQYRILLPPGKYDLRGPGKLPIETITIPAEDPPAEFLRDYNLP